MSPSTVMAPAPQPAVEAVRLGNPFTPHMARIVGVQRMVPDNTLFTFRFLDDEVTRSFAHRPGQFIMLSIPGAGEAPISISSSPTRPQVLELCVRRAGRVTDALYRLKVNDLVGIRGPYGNGFPVEEMIGSDVVMAAGGLGMAPLRSLLWYVLDKRSDYGNLTLMYGGRNPEGMLYRNELSSLVDRTDIHTLLAVDADPSGTWKYHVCRLADLFDHAEIDPAVTHAAVCGPPIVYRFILQRLLKLGFSKDRILMSLERHMKCGVGKCGHCSIGYKYTCVHGPIFTYWDAINLPEMI
jgi:sulfhydrogenase subunit gamma (sulfur reductase)